MDHFGIGAAVQGSVRILLHSARGTGRTTSLVESLKNGDRVVFVNRQEARRVESLCKERGIKIDCLVVDPADPRRAFERGSAQGRTLFDHSWVEQYYLLAIDRAGEAVDEMQRELSWEGQAHRETRLRAQEIRKWQW